MKTKTLITLVTIVLGSWLLASCGDNSAKRVAQQFLQLYYIDNDFDAVAKLVTEASLEPLAHTSMMYEFDPSSRLDLFQEFKILSIDVQKSKAICYYEVDGIKRRILLSKIDGQWFVDMPGDVTRGGADLSLSLTPPNSGGFASAESELTRVGDVPERK
ncbi:MAG: hypothetical protein FWG79_09600 [Bacteroidales bacterium]|nr:hypothetical protein [Bacteroidales bacterium]